MAFAVTFEIERSFEAACTPEAAYAVVADVPFSVSHFPKVEELVDLGGGVYRWEMSKIGIQKYSIQTIYACKYTTDPDKLSVKWTPVKGEGNAAVAGSWKVKKGKEKETQLTLKTKGEMEVPLPAMLRMVLAPVVRGEFERMVDQYIQNLTKSLESGKQPPKKKAAAKKRSK